MTRGKGQERSIERTTTRAAKTQEAVKRKTTVSNHEKETLESRERRLQAAKKVKTHETVKQKKTSQDHDYDYSDDETDGETDKFIEGLLREKEKEIEREREKMERGRREMEREKEEREREREIREREKEKEREREGESEDRERGERNKGPETERVHPIPPQLEGMDDKLQICNWLVNHADVLHLACQMLNMKEQAASTTQASSVPSQLAPFPSVHNDNDSYRLLDEELKILFLKTRNPPDHVFVKLVQKIFGLNAHNNLAITMIKRSRASFSDYRYNFKSSLDSLVKEFRSNESGVTLSRDDVNNFISREVVFKKILKRYISSVNTGELSERAIDKLIDLCRSCFTIVWEERGSDSKIVYNRISSLDTETEGLIIPSRSGENVVNTIITNRQQF